MKLWLNLWWWKWKWKNKRKRIRNSTTIGVYSDVTKQRRIVEWRVRRVASIEPGIGSQKGRRFKSRFDLILWLRFFHPLFLILFPLAFNLLHFSRYIFFYIKIYAYVGSVESVEYRSFRWMAIAPVTTIKFIFIAKVQPFSVHLIFFCVDVLLLYVCMLSIGVSSKWSYLFIFTEARKM